MKFLIKFNYFGTDKVCEGEMYVWAEDARYAIRLVETDLDVLSAKVISVNPVEETVGPEKPKL